MIIDYLVEYLNEGDIYQLTNIDNLVKNMVDATDTSIKQWIGKTVGDLLRYAEKYGVFINHKRYPNRILDKVIEA